MKTKLLLTLLLVPTLTLAAEARRRPSSSLVSDYSGPLVKHEIYTEGTQSALTFGGGTTAFVIRGGYNYTVLPEVQVGGQIGLATGGGATAFAFLVGPTLNIPFGGDLRDTFYLSGQLGLGTVSAGTVSSTDFAFAVALGKRFQLLPNVSYRPNFTLGKSGPGSVTYTFNFIAGSVMF